MIPLGLFFVELVAPLPPAEVLISAINPHDLWADYLRYIGAGAVAFGGLVSLCKAMPTIWESVAAVLESCAGIFNGAAEDKGRTSRDMSYQVRDGGLGGDFSAHCPQQRHQSHRAHRGLVDRGIFLFFVTVSSRIVGIVGSTSMPLGNDHRSPFGDVFWW